MNTPRIDRWMEETDGQMYDISDSNVSISPASESPLVSYHSIPLVSYSRKALVFTRFLPRTDSPQETLFIPPIHHTVRPTCKHSIGYFCPQGFGTVKLRPSFFIGEISPEKRNSKFKTEFLCLFFPPNCWRFSSGEHLQVHLAIFGDTQNMKVGNLKHHFILKAIVAIFGDFSN